MMHVFLVLGAFLLLPILLSMVLFSGLRRAMTARETDIGQAIREKRQKRFEHALRQLQLSEQHEEIDAREFRYYRDKLTAHYQPLIEPHHAQDVDNAASTRKRGQWLLIGVISLLPLMSLMAYWVLVFTPDTGDWLQANHNVATLAAQLSKQTATEDGESGKESGKESAANIDTSEWVDVSTFDMARVLQSTLAHDVQSVSGWMRLGLLYENASGDQLSNLAYQAYEKAYQLTPADGAVAVNFARVNLAVQRFDDADAILDAVLARDPSHDSALLMSGFSAFRQQDYDRAIAHWQRVLASRQGDSQSRQIIMAQIAQAQAAKDAQASQWQLSVVVESAQPLPPAAFLFVAVKAADSPAPVAVKRLAAVRYPVSITLSDADAMMASRQLSDYQSVTVQAFVSLSGNPMDKSGGLSLEVPVQRGETKLPVQLVLNQ